MKKAALRMLDFILISSILTFFYIRAFYGHGRDPIPSELARWRNVCFLLTLVSIGVLPFRVKSYPALANYILFNRNGKKRSSIIIPLLSMLSVIFCSIFIIRVAVLLLGKAG